MRIKRQPALVKFVQLHWPCCMAQFARARVRVSNPLRHLAHWFWRVDTTQELSLPEPSQQGFYVQVRLAQQRFAAARLLWSLRHKQDSLRLFADTLAVLNHAFANDSVQHLPQLRGVPERLSVIQALLQSADLFAPWGILSAAQHRRMRLLVRQFKLCFAQLREATMPRTQQVLPRLVRLALALIGLTLLGGCFWLKAHPPLRVAVQASSSYGSASGQYLYEPRNAVDGTPLTEWLGSNYTQDWLEFRLNRERDIEAVHILNGHGVFNDRAIKAFSLRFFHGEAEILSLHDEFEAFSATPSVKILAVQVKQVDRVILQVQSWHGFGASLAEFGLVVR